MGLAPIIVEQIFDIIQQLNREGMTVLLVEQNAFQALQIAHRGYVMQTGEILMEDEADLLLANEQVKEAYLA
ncbi:High-affinity branched-chain amino acid transport ATP-binding protein LivF [compost metagenome]